MPDPILYNPDYSYSNWQASNPTKPLPAPRVDNDFANISQAVNQAVAAIKDIRRADGKLKNAIVTADSLAPGIVNQLINGAIADVEAARDVAISAASTATAAELGAVEAAESAENERILAQAAAASVLLNDVVSVPTRTDMKALPLTKKVAQIRGEKWRNGIWTLALIASLTAGQQAAVAADTREGLFAKSTVDANYVWSRALAPRATYDVDWWGVNRDGATSDSAAFIAANAVVSSLGGGWVEANTGSYFLSSTIVITDGVYFKGQGGTRTILSRTGSYGDTFRQTSGFAKIRGFFMMHGNLPSAGAGSMNFVLTDGTAHIRLNNTQDAEIAENIIWRMPYGIINDGGINSRIDNNWITGWWNNENPTMQEGIADLLFIGTTQHGQLAKVRGNYFSGGYNGTRDYAFTDSLGNARTATAIGHNTGRQNCIRMQSIEDVEVTGNYFGRASSTLIRIVSGVAVSDLMLDVRITANFFDNAGNGASHISTETLTAGKFVFGLSVVGNTFNGEYDTLHSVYCLDGSGQPTAVDVTVVGNTMFALVGAPVALYGARVGSVAGNGIYAYNCLNFPMAGGLEMISGVHVAGSSDNVIVDGNAIGGGGNNADPITANYCYAGVSIPYVNLKLNSSGANMLMLGHTDGNGRRGVSDNSTRVITGGGQTNANDKTIIVMNGTAAGMSVALPRYPTLGTKMTVKDGIGNATTYVIQIIPGSGVATIDGASSVTINVNFGSKTFVYNGTQWNVI